MAGMNLNALLAGGPPGSRAKSKTNPDQFNPDADEGENVHPTLERPMSDHRKTNSEFTHLTLNRPKISGLRKTGSLKKFDSKHQLF